MGTSLPIHLNDAEIEEFGREIGAIYDEVKADLGERDAGYIRRLIKIQRSMALGGRIELRCTEGAIDNQPAVHVVVCDNGPGLNPEQKQKIFDPFFTTKTKGTGLGMAIAKRLVEAHGGVIAVGPAVNGGAEIELVIPRAPR